MFKLPLAKLTIWISSGMMGVGGERMKNVLCGLRIHRWQKYNLGWRRYCKSCGKLQIHGIGGRARWGDTDYANWGGKDTDCTAEVVAHLVAERLKPVDN